MIVPHIELCSQPVDIRAYPRVPDAGAIVEFSGVVRGSEDGRPIAGIEYEAFPEMAIAELERIAAEIIQQFDPLECLVIHRVGFVPTGEVAVYLRTAARHREEAYRANIAFLEALKRRVPIWKHVQFSE